MAKSEFLVDVSKLDKGQQEALKLAMAAVEKECGADSLQVYGAGESLPGQEFFSSGCFSLDNALGGGYAKGRIVEIFGPESSGKTTLALLAVANAQKSDPRPALYVDMEHALDPTYAQKLGVDMGRLILSQPDSAEKALNVMNTLLKSGSISIVIVDSVSSLVPEKELEGDIGDQSMGVQARLMSQTLRMITGTASRHQTTVIFINQIRMKIGVMFGNPETTSGGNSLKFYASQRIDVRRRDKVKEPGGGEDAAVIGCDTHVKVIKNKVAPPFREAEFTIKFGEGIDWAADLVNAATVAGVLEKSGTWYSFQGERVGQGERNAAQYFKDNPDKKEALVTALRSA